MPDAVPSLPGMEYVGPASGGGAPPSLPGMEYVGPAQRAGTSPQVQTPSPAQPAMVTTPEMAARQQMGEENAQRGTATSFGAGILGNFQGLAGEFQNALAGPVGIVAPGAAENMRIAAARSLAYGANPEHPIAGTAGGLVGTLPGAFAGPAGAALSAANTGAQTFGNVEAQKDEGAKIGAGAELTDVALQTGLSYLMNRVGQKNLTGPIPKKIISGLMPELTSKFGAGVARAVAATAVEGGVGVGTQAASNLITKFGGPGGQGVNPNQSVTEGLVPAGIGGALLGGGGRTLHEILSAPHGAPKPTELEQPTATQTFLERPQAHEEATPKVEAAPEAPKSTTETAQPPAAQAEPEPWQRKESLPDVVTRREADPARDAIVMKQRDFLEAKSRNDPAADHMAAEIQQHLADYEQTHGEDKAEDLIAEIQGLKHEPTSPETKAELDRILAKPSVQPPAEMSDREVQHVLDTAGYEGLPKTAEAAPTEPEKFRLPEHTIEEPSKFQNMLATAGRRKGAMAIPTQEDLLGKGSIYKEEVKPHLDQAVGVLKEITSGLRKHFPTETGAGDKNTAQIAREEFNRGKNENLSNLERLKPAQDLFDKLNPKDRLDFQRRMYNGDTQSTPELQAVAKEGYEQARARKQAMIQMGKGHAQAWDDQHYNMLWKKDPTLAERLMRVSGPGAIEGTKGFLKKRVDTDFDAKLKQGLVPVYDNPIDMMVATDAEFRKFQAGHNTMDRLIQKNQIARYEDPKQVPNGWTEAPAGTKGILKDLLPGDSKAYMPEPVASILRNITTPSAFQGSKAFEAVRTINNVLTQAKLGLSAFHLRKVGQETIGLELGRAFDLAMKGDYVKAARAVVGAPLKPITQIWKGKNIEDMMLDKVPPSSPLEARVIDSLKTSMTAKPDPAFETQIRRNMKRAWADGGIQGVLRAGARLPFAVNEKLMQDGVFEYAQRAKLARASEMVGDFLKKNPNASDDALHAETAKISDHLDNVLGLMNRDNLFWSKTARDAATVSMLSVGWNFGSGRALAGGVVDLGKGLGSLAKGGKISDLDSRRASYLATTGFLTAMTGAITQYLATGKPPGSMKDLVYPKTGAQDREGHDARINTGFYTSDWYDFIHDPIGTFGNKASPLVHAATDLVRNKDFSGTEVWDKNGTWGNIAADIGKYLVKAGVPLSIEQLDRLRESGTKSPTLSALSMVGFKTARTSLSESDAELLAHDLMQKGGSRTPGETAKSNMLRKYTNEIRDKSPEANEDIRKAVASHEISPANVHEIQKRAKEAGGLKGLLTSPELHPDDMMKVWDKMTDAEKQQYQWQVRGRIGRSDKTGPEKQAMFQKVQQDMKAK